MTPVRFEQWGIRVDVVPAILVFVGACAVGVVAAVLLWLRRTALAGAILALVAVVVHSVFWIGFDLPFGPPGGAIVLVLVIAGLVLRRARRRDPQ